MPTWRYETTNAYTQINAHNWHIDKRGRVNFTNEHGQVIAVLNDWQTITRTDAIHNPDNAEPATRARPTSGLPL